MLHSLRPWITRSFGRWVGIALVLIMAQAGVPQIILHSHVDADHSHDHVHSETGHQIEALAELLIEHPLAPGSDRPLESDTLAISSATSEQTELWHVHDCGLTALALPVLPHALLGSPVSVPFIIGDPPAVVRHAPLAVPYRPPILS